MTAECDPEAVELARLLVANDDGTAGSCGALLARALLAVVAERDQAVRRLADLELVHAALGERFESERFDYMQHSQLDALIAARDSALARCQAMGKVVEAARACLSLDWLAPERAGWTAELREALDALDRGGES